ncbi:MAG TPA: beta-galactosidase [Microbacterium sp.]|nr:beta-galactosidase [Microbacterium sp.]
MPVSGCSGADRVPRSAWCSPTELRRALSGAIHYFPAHPAGSQDRIRKARLLGRSMSGTYVAWNASEPRRGEWDASGWHDVGGRRRCHGFFSGDSGAADHGRPRTGDARRHEPDGGALPRRHGRMSPPAFAQRTLSTA